MLMFLDMTFFPNNLAKNYTILLMLALTKPNTILNVFKYYFEKLFLIYFMKYI